MRDYESRIANDAAARAHHHARLRPVLAAAVRRPAVPLEVGAATSAAAPTT